MSFIRGGTLVSSRLLFWFTVILGVYSCFFSFGLLRHVASTLPSRGESTIISTTDNDSRSTTAVLPKDFRNYMQLPHIDHKTRKLLDIKQIFHGNAVPNGDDASEIITIATQLNVNPTRLQRLADIASRWEDGYISVAVYLRNKEGRDQDDLLRFINSSMHSWNAFAKTIVYAVTDTREANETIPHPVNILRNIAIEKAPTNRVLMLDVDFVPSMGAHAQLIKHLSSMTDEESSRTALIIPAFERNLVEGEDETMSGLSLDLPSRKEELISSMGERVDMYRVFHDRVCSRCHKPTNYNKWYNASHPYRVEYKHMFEPYYVINKHSGLPPFWEFFAGFGANKWTWVTELSFAGYNFMVAPDCFLVHVNHKKSREKRPETFIELRSRFSKHLQDTYGRSIWKDKKNWQKYWDQLSAELKAAANLLGFDRKSWDNDVKIAAYNKTAFNAKEIEAIELLDLQRYFQGYYGGVSSKNDANVIIVGAAHGSTGTHLFYYATCHLGFPSVHWESGCLPRNEIQPSSTVQDRFASHESLRLIIHGMRKCFVKGRLSCGNALEWRTEVLSLIDQIVQDGNIRAFHDTPYPSLIAPLTQSIRRHNKTLILLQSERNPEQYAQSRLRHHYGSRDLLCIDPSPISASESDLSGGPLDFVGCVTRAIEKSDNPEQLDLVDLFVSYRTLVETNSTTAREIVAAAMDNYQQMISKKADFSFNMFEAEEKTPEEALAYALKQQIPALQNWKKSSPTKYVTWNYWDDLNEETLKAAKLLGFTKEKWNYESSLPIYSVPFDELKDEEKDAVTKLRLRFNFAN